MLIVGLDLLVCIIGLLMYVLANPAGPNGPRVSEIGRIMFFSGLLAFLLSGQQILVALNR